MPRLFTAIEIPEVHTTALRSLQRDLEGARWERHLHLTLVFFGTVEAADDLAAGLGEVEAEPFAIELVGAGMFESNTRQGVAWAGIAPSPALADVRDAVAAVAADLDLYVDDRPFVPHVTLARGPLEDVRRFVTEVEVPSLPPIAVGEFVLFESSPSDEGPVHSVRRRYELE